MIVKIESEGHRDKKSSHIFRKNNSQFTKYTWISLLIESFEKTIMVDCNYSRHDCVNIKSLNLAFIQAKGFAESSIAIEEFPLLFFTSPCFNYTYSLFTHSILVYTFRIAIILRGIQSSSDPLLDHVLKVGLHLIWSYGVI